MSIDARLVGTDNDEYEDYYGPFLERVVMSLGEQGITVPNISFGATGQNYGDKIGDKSAIHLLRSYAACIAFNGEPPVEPDISVICYELNEMYAGRMKFEPFAHLIKHSDEDGFYVPIEFPTPFTMRKSEDGFDSWACNVGSSQALLKELDELNKYLKVPGDYGELCGSARLRQEIQGDVFEKEKWVWGLLRWLARESVAKNVMLEFC